MLNGADIQKNAKQAIFSLHRGALEKSQSQIEACGELLPTRREAAKPRDV